MNVVSNSYRLIAYGIGGKCSFAMAVVICVAACGLLSADTVYQSDYSSLNAGELQFQDGWLGQTGSIVDPVAGTVTRGPGGFLRNVNGNGALGTPIDTLAGPGFKVGDRIKISTSLRYVLGATTNQNLSLIGIRQGFGAGPDLGNFDAVPLVDAGGIRTAYSSFGGGSIKVYTNLARQGFEGADNAFAVFVTGTEGGFNGADAGQSDLMTDLLEFRYEAVFNGVGFQATQLLVTNLDTNTVVADAAVENPAALEASTYNFGDAYLAQRLISGDASTAIQSGVSFEFHPIPEPASLVILFGLGGISCLTRRR